MHQVLILLIENTAVDGHEVLRSKSEKVGKLKGLENSKVRKWEGQWEEKLKTFAP
jgi:hypothetical protein